MTVWIDGIFSIGLTLGKKEPNELLQRLVPISFFGILLIGLMIGLYIYQTRTSMTTVEVIWQEGNFSFHNPEGENWEPVKDNVYPVQSWFRSGEESGNIRTFDVSSYGVLKYGHLFTVVLNNDSGLRYRLTAEGKMNFIVSGSAHFYIESDDDTPLEVMLNNTLISTPNAELHYVYLENKEKIEITSGTVSVSTAGNWKDMRTVNKGMPVILSENTYMEVQENMFDVGTFNAETDVEFQNSYMPGFSTVAPIEIAGEITPKRSTFSLTRNGKVYTGINKKVPFSKGDRVKTGSDETAMIHLYSDDRIRLYENSILTSEDKPDFEWSFYDIKRQIKHFDLAWSATPVPREDVLLLSKSTVKKNKNLNFHFSGSIRAGINPKIKRRRVRFKSAEAIVSVRGTEFKASSKEGETGVMTLNGAVALKTPYSDKEVEIKDLEFSKATVEDPPDNPREVSTKEYQELMNDVFLDRNNKPLYIEKAELETYKTGLMQQIFCRAAYDPNLANKDDATIRDFQSKMDIRIDGIVGPETRGKLKEMLQCQEYNESQKRKTERQKND